MKLIELQAVMIGNVVVNQLYDTWKPSTQQRRIWKGNEMLDKIGFRRMLAEYGNHEISYVAARECLDVRLEPEFDHNRNAYIFVALEPESEFNRRNHPCDR